MKDCDIFYTRSPGGNLKLYMQNTKFVVGTEYSLGRRLCYGCCVPQSVRNRLGRESKKPDISLEYQMF